MSTGLVVYERNDFAAIAENSSVRQAMQENMLPGERFSEMDLIRAGNPTSGGEFWTIEGEPVRTIEGVLLFNAWHGLIWPSMEIGSGMKPVVRSNDLQFGKLNLSEEEIESGLASKSLDPAMMETLKKHEIAGSPGVYKWDELPWTQMGTGRKGFGKFAQEARLLFILRKEDAWPLVVKAGPGSLTSVGKLIKRLSVPQYRAVVQLSLESAESKSGVKYSMIVGKHVGTLSPEVGAELKEQYTDRLRASHEAGRVYADAEPVDDLPTVE